MESIFIILILGNDERVMSSNLHESISCDQFVFVIHDFVLLISMFVCSLTLSIIHLPCRCRH